MLLFERELIEESTPYSNLSVLAKGLPFNTIISTQLSFYAFPSTLTLIMNTTDVQNNYFIKNTNLNIIPEQFLTSTKRTIQYQEGGLIIVNSQTLLTDLLNNHLNPEIISALFILNVEELTANCNISFIIDYIRRKNGDAIIRGYSNNINLLNLETATSLLQVHKVFIFPRFSESVINSLTYDTRIKEKRLKITKEIEELQIYILETFKGIFRELLKEDRYNHALKEMIADFELSKLLLARRICKKIVDQSGYKSMIRQLYTDTSNFKLAVDLLFGVDFNSFYEVLNIFYNEQIRLNDKSTWINLESGMSLMEKAIAINGKDVAYEQELLIKNIKEIKKSKILTKSEEDTSNDSLDLNTEIKRTKTEYKHSKVDELLKLIGKCDSSFLVLVRNSFIKEIILRIINEIYEERLIVVLTHKEFAYDEDIFDNYVFMCPDIGSIRKIEVLQNKQIVEKNIRIVDLLAKNCIKEDTEFNANNKIMHLNKDNHNNVKCKNIPMFIPSKCLENNNTPAIEINIEEIQMSKNTNLNENNKEEGFVSFYNEVSINQNVFFLFYRDSLEEQQYLHEIHHEKDLFTKMIRKYVGMSFKTYDSKIILDETDDRVYSIIIDFREMRCALPYFLYRCGNDINISTCETGDYIIGRNSCVERKTIPDFIGSLNSGRICTQIRMMNHKYKNIFLLLEFDGQRPSFYDLTVKNNLIQRFVLLLLNFPRLKVIWSVSNLSTIGIFREIQRKDDNAEDMGAEEMDPTLFEILMSIPGIDVYNYKRVMSEFSDLQEIVMCTKEIMQQILGRENGVKVFKFFNDRME